MKKNKKGFTLIELLAVIVVLGVIMSIAGTAVLKQKKKANQGEIDSLYNTIKGFGADVYLIEKESACYSDSWLKAKGYLKSEVVSPSNGEKCEAYLIIDKSDINDNDNDNDMFKAYIKCPGLDEKGTRPTDPSSCKQS